LIDDVRTQFPRDSRPLSRSDSSVAPGTRGN
jgi:hypothetical protein